MVEHPIDCLAGTLSSRQEREEPKHPPLKEKKLAVGEV
jgi:hypothetical protein